MIRKPCIWSFSALPLKSREFARASNLTVFIQHLSKSGKQKATNYHGCAKSNGSLITEVLSVS